MLNTIILSTISAIIFALINFFSLRIRVYTGKHKLQVLSLFSGVTAAFVFLDLLPSVENSKENLLAITNSYVPSIIYEDAIFLVVFIGFLLFFTLECLAVDSTKTARLKNPKDENPHPSKNVYFVHFAALAFLQFILSFSLVFEYQTSVFAGVFFTFAVSLHLFVSENTMTEEYSDLHGRNGRVIATIIPIVGLIASLIFPEKIAEASVLLAFISGAIFYQAIRNEIPMVKRKYLVLFLAGAVFYALLLLAYEFASWIL